MSLLKLNLGCGQSHIPGFVNCDLDASLQPAPDKVFDLMERWPFDNNSCELVLLSHIIEHIPEPVHPRILIEAHRVLTMGSEIVLTYPEFEACALNYIANAGGKREYWKWCIFGRQTTPLDIHVSLMDSARVKLLMYDLGFEVKVCSPEPNQHHNTIIRATKVDRLPTYDEVLAKDVFGKDLVIENA